MIGKFAIAIDECTVSMFSAAREGRRGIETLRRGCCFVAAGIWHPDNAALTRVRSAIVQEPERWAAIRKKLELEGDSLTRPPRGFDPKHPFVEDLKRKDFIASMAFGEAEICSKNFMKDFSAACRKMSPLVEFTTKALGLKY